jgi:hypothetical protein
MNAHRSSGHAGRICCSRTSQPACWPPRHDDHSGGADSPRRPAWHPQDGHRPGRLAGLPATRPICLACRRFPHAPHRRVPAEPGARSRQRHRPSATHSGHQRADAVLHAARVPDRARIPEAAAVRHADVAGPRCAAGLSAAIVTFRAGAAGPHGMAAVLEIRTTTRPSPRRKVLP